jgi:hypothetical protein
MKSQLKKIKSLFPVLVAVITLISCKKENSGGNNSTDTLPQITNIQPKNPQPGDAVVITGTGFGTVATDAKVIIGSTELTLTSVSPTEIKFNIPATISSGNLALLIKGITAINKDPQGAAITITPKTTTAPTFTAMAPNNGKTGDVITLTGTNFNPQPSENKVFFATVTGGTVVLATIKTATTTTLTVEVPANVITGSVLITVNGNNAIVATGFNATFTVNPATGGTGSNSVDYINALSGNLKFSKVVSATKEIGSMYIDKFKNVLYYSDYAISNVSTVNTIYKVDLAGSGTAIALSTDTRLDKTVKITTDADGNIYALKYESGLNFSIYKISPNGATITEIVKNFELVGKYYFYINNSNQLCIRPNLRFTAQGAAITSGPTLSGLQQKDAGALFSGNTVYFSQVTDNTAAANKCKFIKYDLSTDTYIDADFTLKSLFNDDDPSLFSASNNISWLKYALDGNENLYALMDHTYISGSTSKTWLLRKTKNGSGASTLLGRFVIKFPAIDLNDYNSSLEFLSDANGNLYFKANVKDIIKIVQ